ncbi:MAG: M20 family metallopeptidase [Candidatus Auribacterota bacterium]|nr:M20 family metallopeptidase [Candidatus Auribacterota bacterium]
MINKKRLVALTQKVIRINSENPPGNEWQLSQFIRKDMQSLGLVVKEYTYQKKRPNIIAIFKGTWPRQKAAKEAVLITPHFDTVPAGKGWKVNPFGGKIQGGRIYGRGASDDKGNLACCMEVMRSLTEDKIRLKRDVIMAATVDEETGSHCGIVPLLDKGVLNPTAALILDSDEFDTIIAQKGLLHSRVKIFGKKAHGAYNWRGKNAIEIASKAICAIKRHRFRYKHHPLLRPPTVNIGTIEGGDKVNIVADYCEFSLDIRFLPGMNPMSVITEIKDIIKKEEVKFKLEISDLQYPYEIDAQHPLIQTWVSTCKRLKRKPTLKGSEGATVITFFKKRGIPAFATGFGSHGIAHCTDEYASMNTLYKGAKVLEEFLKEFDRR